MDDMVKYVNYILLPIYHYYMIFAIKFVNIL